MEAGGSLRGPTLSQINPPIAQVVSKDQSGSEASVYNL
jgi:hypothetical protein